MPSKTFQTHKSDSPDEPSKANTIPPSYLTTRGPDYEHKLRDFERTRDAMLTLHEGGLQIRPYNIEPPDENEDKPDPENIDIALGILCVTEAISQTGLVKFAYYDVLEFDICQQGGCEDYPCFAVHRPDAPIYIPYSPYETYKVKGRVQHKGHHILVVAHPGRVGGMDHAQVKIYDSAPKWLLPERAKIEANIEQLLRSSWATAPLDRVYTFDWVPVAGQDVDMCGIHVILNAWSLAMGLRAPRQKPSPPPALGRTASRAASFYRDAARLISCAVHGCADYDLIMAFLRYWTFLDNALAEPPVQRRFIDTFGVHKASWAGDRLDELRQASNDRKQQLDMADEARPAPSKRKVPSIQRIEQITTSQSQAALPGPSGSAGPQTTKSEQTEPHPTDSDKPGEDSETDVFYSLTPDEDRPACLHCQLSGHCSAALPATFQSFDAQPKAPSPDPRVYLQELDLRTRLVVNEESEAYERLSFTHDAFGLHGLGAIQLAALFTNPPNDPTAKNVKRRMVDAAEQHFWLKARLHDNMTSAAKSQGPTAPKTAASEERAHALVPRKALGVIG